MNELTPAELKALRRVLDRVHQIVGNNSPWWTGRYGNEILQSTWTKDVEAAHIKLKEAK